MLATSRSTVITCRIRTAVDEPGDAFDTYGRLVGDVHLASFRGAALAKHRLQPGLPAATRGSFEEAARRSQPNFLQSTRFRT